MFYAVKELGAFNKKSKFWCVTDHTRLVSAGWKDFFDFNQRRIVYLVGQLERSPTTGKRHVQAYVVFKCPQSLSAVKRLLPTAHLEMARGSPIQNKEYCSKQETRIATDDGGFQFEVICRTSGWDVSPHCLFHEHYLWVNDLSYLPVRSDAN